MSKSPFVNGDLWNSPLEKGDEGGCYAISAVRGTVTNNLIGKLWLFSQNPKITRNPIIQFS